MSEALDGLILLNKPAGVTSFQALRPIKQLLPKKTKVGHTGTLDKFATGLLPVLFGKATRLVPLFSNFDKTYDGVVRFGEETETLDTESPVRTRGEAPSREALEAALGEFRGEIDQVPPLYSAVHLQGERAYRRVLRGEEVDIPARRVTVYNLQLLDYTPPEATISVSCSKGTYIRSLARDLGAACDCGAYLTSLTRTRVGPFSVEAAIAEPTLESAWSLETMVEAIGEIRQLDLSGEEASRVKNGAKLATVLSEGKLSPLEGRIALRAPSGRIIAIAEAGEGGFSYILVRP